MKRNGSLKGMLNHTATLENNKVVSFKTGMGLPCDPGMSVSGIYQRNK